MHFAGEPPFTRIDLARNCPQGSYAARGVVVARYERLFERVLVSCWAFR